MSDVTTNVPALWMPPHRIVTFDVTVTVGAPSPGAVACYDATTPRPGGTS